MTTKSDDGERYVPRLSYASYDGDGRLALAGCMAPLFVSVECCIDLWSLVARFLRVDDASDASRKGQVYDTYG